MPKIDPVTGVPVMTWGEFWQSMADNNSENPDNDPGKEMEDFYKEIAKEEQAELDHLKIPENALSFISNTLANCWEQGDDLIVPMKIIEIIYAHYGGWRNIYIELDARCEFIIEGETSVKRIKVTYQYYAGTRLDPPDEEYNWEFVDE